MSSERQSFDQVLAAAFHDYRIYRFEIRPSPSYDVPATNEQWVRLLETSRDGQELLNTLGKLRQHLELKMCFDDCADHHERGNVYDEIAPKYGQDVYAEIAGNNKLRGGKIIGIYLKLENLSGILQSLELSTLAAEVALIFQDVQTLFAGRTYDEISEDRDELYNFILAYDQLILRVLYLFI